MTSNEKTINHEAGEEDNSNTEHVCNVSINEKLLKVSEPFDQDYDNEDQIEDFKSNIISLQQLLASKESEYEDRIHNMESDHRKKIEEFEAKEKKYNSVLRQNVQKCINLRKEQIEFMHLYTRAQIKIKMYENNCSIQEFVTNLLNMVDFYSQVNKLESCKTDCPDKSAHQGLKERIKNLEEGVKTVVTICSLKDTQMELLSSKIKRSENDLNSFKQQIAKEILEEDISDDHRRTQNMIKKLTCEKLQLLEKVQQLESKNSALSKVIQETAGEFYKSEQLLKDDFSKLRRHVIALYSEGTDKVIPTGIKDLITPGLKDIETPLCSDNTNKETDSDISCSSTTELAGLDSDKIKQPTDTNDITPVQTREKTSDISYQRNNINILSDTEGEKVPDKQINNNVTGIGVDSIPTSCNADDSCGSGSDAYSYNDAMSYSYQVKKNKKTVSWSDKANITGSSHSWSANRKTGRHQRKEENVRYRSPRSYRHHHVDYDNDKDQEGSYTSPKHKQKNDRHKRQTSRWN